MRPSETHGFTLVELSIVLVILGLLTGGILTGQSLIRAAELRAVATEFALHQSAIHSFRDRYSAVAGDMPNATSFWGEAAAGAACATTATSDIRTCNGNGNGDVASSTNSNEPYRFWQHLSNAGLIEGSYAGISSGGGALINYNVPASKTDNAGWCIGRWGGTGGDLANFAFGYRHHLVFGINNPGIDTSGKALKPEEAWNIDQKLDDGKPAQGRIWAIHWNDCTDATANTDYDSDYLFSDTTKQCAFRILLGW